MNDMAMNNTAELTGEIVSSFIFSHSCNGENFYKTYLKTLRKSEHFDTIPIMVSDRLFDVNIAKNCIGVVATVVGQFRSHNGYGGKKNTLELFMFATEFHLGTAEEDINLARLNGFICKKPVYRTTPANREITDLLIAVNRSCGKSDYIPCIAWSRNARYASKLSIGTKVELEGRIQSREYLKKLDDGSCEARTAYEVSASRIEVVESEENEDESRSEENL